MRKASLGSAASGGMAAAAAAGAVAGSAAAAAAAAGGSAAAADGAAGRGASVDVLEVEVERESDEVDDDHEDSVPYSEDFDDWRDAPVMLCPDPGAQQQVRVSLCVRGFGPG